MSTFDKKGIFNPCLLCFLQTYTHHDTDDDKQYVVVPVIVKLGKRMLSHYFNTLRDSYFKDNSLDNILFSEFKDK